MGMKEDALEYHRQGRPGKVAVVPTKAVASQRDLALAYSPGVAEPCRVIAKDPSAASRYTARSNLVAVISNGTAVLGLGDIGPLASKPVMEGKGVLFKKFADIDVFDIELDEKDPDKLVDIIAALEPTFGGINLEDIKAPECFIVERKLRERMKIPVFHDDQHGTAIICGAALVNAAQVQGKERRDLTVVCLGAGASAVACMELWVRLGVKRENITMCDSKGVIKEDREGGLNEFKARFARPGSEPDRSLAEALVGADVFVGLASGNLVTGDMIKPMAERPIIFTLSNPDPEIPYEQARAARPDAIVATGRSDYPNQVNNVLGFPYIFRGALDVGASTINEEMKLAAAVAIADLAREAVPDQVLAAYGGDQVSFGADYIIPKPFDQRVLYWVAPAVARAAIETGVASDDFDIDAYRQRLIRTLSPTSKLMWNLTTAVKRAPRRVVFCEGHEPRILRAASILRDEGLASPILIGRMERLQEQAREQGVSLDGMELVEPRTDSRLPQFVESYHALRARKGVTHYDALRVLSRQRTYFGMMMLHGGHAEVLVSGLTRRYPDTIRPALEVIGLRKGVSRAAGMHLVITDRDVRLMADTTLQIEPSAEQLAEIGGLVGDAARQLGMEPRLAMLSFSTFGSAPHERSERVARAAAQLQSARPDLQVEGEMQADIALRADLRDGYPFSRLSGDANVLVFPNLDAGNIAFKLAQADSGADVIGPILLGMAKPVALLTRTDTVDDIVNATIIAASEAIGGRERPAGAETGEGHRDLQRKGA